MKSFKNLLINEKLKLSNKQEPDIINYEELYEYILEKYNPNLYSFSHAYIDDKITNILKINVHKVLFQRVLIHNLSKDDREAIEKISEMLLNPYRIKHDAVNILYTNKKDFQLYLYKHKGYKFNGYLLYILDFNNSTYEIFNIIKDK